MYTNHDAGHDVVGPVEQHLPGVRIPLHPQQENIGTHPNYPKLLNYE